MVGRKRGAAVLEVLIKNVSKCVWNGENVLRKFKTV